LEELKINFSLSKAEKYAELYRQIPALIRPEPDLTANLANVAAAIHFSFGWLWTGWYIRRGNELVLGPFQGPVACTRIGINHGVCGSAVRDKATLIVRDVSKFPGHIACSPDSKSEIVVPVFRKNEVAAVLDIDSRELNSFDAGDQKGLEDLVKILSENHPETW